MKFVKSLFKYSY